MAHNPPKISSIALPFRFFFFRFLSSVPFRFSEGTVLEVILLFALLKVTLSSLLALTSRILISSSFSAGADLFFPFLRGSGSDLEATGVLFIDTFNGI